MRDQAVTHDTFVIERTYPASPEQVFRAFADPDLKRRWFAEGEQHAIEAFEMDFRVGGAELLRYRLAEGTPFKGTVVISDARYLDILPNQRIVTASVMDFAGRCISASLVTVEFLEREQATHLVCTHQGAFFAGSDGPRIREAGWHKLLGQLAGRLDELVSGSVPRG